MSDIELHNINRQLGELNKNLCRIAKELERLNTIAIKHNDILEGEKDDAK